MAAKKKRRVNHSLGEVFDLDQAILAYVTEAASPTRTLARLEDRANHLRIATDRAEGLGLLPASVRGDLPSLAHELLDMFDTDPSYEPFISFTPRAVNWLASKSRSDAIYLALAGEDPTKGLWQEFRPTDRRDSLELLYFIDQITESYGWEHHYEESPDAGMDLDVQYLRTGDWLYEDSLILRRERDGRLLIDSGSWGDVYGGWDREVELRGWTRDPDSGDWVATPRSGRLSSEYSSENPSAIKRRVLR
jgi:hypothetical protein